MRKFVSSLAALVLTAGFALAQPRDIVHVHLAYAVQAAGNTIPAGDYEIRDIQTGSDVPMLLLHSNSYNAIVPVMRVALDANLVDDKTEVVLARSEKGYSLEHLLIEGRTYRYDFR